MAIVVNELGHLVIHYCYFKCEAGITEHPADLKLVIELDDVVMTPDEADTVAKWLKKAAQYAREHNQSMANDTDSGVSQSPIQENNHVGERQNDPGC